MWIIVIFVPLTLQSDIVEVKSIRKR